jgi:hypothetical protein
MKLARVIDPIPGWELDHVKKGDIISLEKDKDDSSYFRHLKTNQNLGGISIDKDGVGRGSGKKRIEWL